MRDRTSILQRLALVLFGVALGLVVLEAGLRAGAGAFLWLQERENRLSLEGERTYRIMCLGESTTALGRRHSYPRQLERILNQRAGVATFSVINKGIPARTTNYILNHIEEYLDEDRPDIVVAMMGVNDWLNDPEYNPPLEKDLMGTSGFWRSLRTYKAARWFWQALRVRSVQRPRKAPNWDGGFLAGIADRSGTAPRKIPTGNAAAENPTGKNRPGPGPPKPQQGLREAPEGNLFWLVGEKLLAEAEPEGELRAKFDEDPNDTNACIGVGSLYAVRDGAAGEAPLRRAIAGQPTAPRHRHILAVYFMALDEIEKADAVLEEALAAGASSPFTHHLRRLILEKRVRGYRSERKFAETEAWLLEALERETDPVELARAHGMLGVHYEMRGDERAEEHFRQAEGLFRPVFEGQTRRNYLLLKKILDARGIPLVAVQYPVRRVDPLKEIFAGEDHVVFVDNERAFKEALRTSDYAEIFTDQFAGDFGHVTRRGNRILAENVARVILEDLLGVEPAAAERPHR